MAKAKNATLNAGRKIAKGLAEKLVCAALDMQDAAPVLTEDQKLWAEQVYDFASKLEESLKEQTE